MSNLTKQGVRDLNAIGGKHRNERRERATYGNCDHEWARVCEGGPNCKHGGCSYPWECTKCGAAR